jgi:HD-GYP domain-containing protein (c-di-GMP phosphodiesterase class II)
VPDAVLLKPGKLTPDEWMEMRKHPDIGFQMIQNIPFLSTPAQIVLSHQERWDGAGYPRNMQKHEIHIGARIFAVADTLDAMTSDRPYRKGTTFANAIQEIKRCANTQFDPEVVRAFLDIGEEGLVRIKLDMAARKLKPLEIEAQAQEAEAELEKLTEDDDMDLTPTPSTPDPYLPKN